MICTPNYNFLLFCSILQDSTNLIFITTGYLIQPLRNFGVLSPLALCRGEQNCLVLSALCKHFYQLVRATHIKDNNFVRLFSSNLEMQTAIVDVVISQFSSNTTTENLIEVEEVFGVGDFVFFAGQFLWRLALLARAG